MADKMLIVSAHMGDFVWRSGGAIAKYVKEGHDVQLLVLSNGLRGEAQDYWKQEGANEIDGAKQRLEEGQRAAEILGLSGFEFWDLMDYPMEITLAHIEALAHKFREFRPDFIVTHDKYDAFNPDHNLTAATVLKAYATASGAGFRDGLPVSPRQTPVFGFEPHSTEICDFKPGIYIDISDVFDIKCQAMQVFSSQPAMFAHYVRKAETRANEAVGRVGRKGCKYAEAFSCFNPVGSTGRFVW